jgi:hypothetical protein
LDRFPVPGPGPVKRRAIFGRLHAIVLAPVPSLALLSPSHRSHRTLADLPRLLSSLPVTAEADSRVTIRLSYRNLNGDTLYHSRSSTFNTCRHSLVTLGACSTTEFSRPCSWQACFPYQCPSRARKRQVLFPHCIYTTYFVRVDTLVPAA